MVEPTAGFTAGDLAVLDPLSSGPNVDSLREAAEKNTSERAG
jgi:hypothetical protein